MSSSNYLPTLAGRLKSRIRRIVTSGLYMRVAAPLTALPASRRKPGKEPQYKRFLTDNGGLPGGYRGRRDFTPPSSLTANTPGCLPSPMTTRRAIHSISA